MNSEDGESRKMVVCVDCGSAYAAHERPDGAYLPIGSPSGCSCGGTIFDPVDSETALEYDESDQASPDE